jgi:uncharacterized membrane protein YidH (DUF202 family)
MKYFAALSVAASVVAAQGDMQVMSLAPAVPSGAQTHTVSTIATSTITTTSSLTIILGRRRWNEARRNRNGTFPWLHP